MGLIHGINFSDLSLAGFFTGQGEFHSNVILLKMKQQSCNVETWLAIEAIDFVGILRPFL